MEENLWIKQAEADFNTAKNSLLSKDYYASVFWSQQVPEEFDKLKKKISLVREVLSGGIIVK